MDFNCLKEGEAPNWKDYCHFYVEPCVATDIQGDGKRIEFVPISLEEEMTGDIKAEVWTVFGLTSQGDTVLIHDSGSRSEAAAVVGHCLKKMNDSRSHVIIANDVLCNFKFSLPAFDPYSYNAVEFRPVKFYLELGVYEECHPEDSPTSWSVYGHNKDPEIGGCECIHDCATQEEMKQLAWILEEVFGKN